MLLVSLLQKLSGLPVSTDDQLCLRPLDTFFSGIGHHETQADDYGYDFLKSIAADWGLGVRVDLSFLVLRLDMGVKLYDPTIETGGWFGPSDWNRKDSFALHFGVGYPF